MTDTRVLDMTALGEVVAEQPHPLMFATVSGAHLYGFASRDSDVDLRGVHVLPPRELLGLHVGPQTLDRDWLRDGVEMDLVTHDVGKFLRLLLKRNGYVLEQLLSPLVVASSPAHEELTALAPGCLTVHHAHHYLGFARTQRALSTRTGELKPLLYTVRVLLTGIHLMRTGEVQPHLPTLLTLVPEAPSWVPEAMQRKAEAEHRQTEDLPGLDRVQDELDDLTGLLEQERDRSALPDQPSAGPALHDFLLRVRLS